MPPQHSARRPSKRGFRALTTRPVPSTRHERCRASLHWVVPPAQHHVWLWVIAWLVATSGSTDIVGGFSNSTFQVMGMAWNTATSALPPSPPEFEPPYPKSSPHSRPSSPAPRSPPPILPAVPSSPAASPPVSQPQMPFAHVDQVSPPSVHTNPPRLPPPTSPLPVGPQATLRLAIRGAQLV